MLRFKYFHLYFSFIICLLTGFSASAQHVNITGAVSDSSNGQLLESATVSLYSQKGPSLIKRQRSQPGFIFLQLKKGDYLIITSYQGYKPDSFFFTVASKDTLALSHDVQLRPDMGSLMQVVVRASIPPAIIKNDTIAFNASAYPSPPNSTVEDMLRKLPGIQIDKDGNVTMQGQKVDKITIDGKDFFLNDLRSASQNLPADIVSQIEVLNTKSKKSRLTGINENSNTKTINIKLKKDKQKGLFGKLYAGGGTENSYSAGGNIMRLNGTQMLMLNGNANNINNQFTGNEHQNGPGTGEQSQNNLQLNYRDAWSKKLNVTIDGGRGYNENFISQQTSRSTVLTDSSILQNSLSTARNKNTSYHASGSFEFALDSLTQINLNSDYALNKTESQTTDTVAMQTQKKTGNYLSSIGKTDNNLSGNNNSLANILYFRKQFRKKGRMVFASIGQSNSNQNQPATLMSVLRNYDSSGSVFPNIPVNQQSNLKTTNSGYSANISYTEPVGARHILDFGYSINHSSGHSDKESFNYDSASQKYDIPDSLTTNRFLNHTTVQSMNVGYNTTEGKYQFQIGLTGQLTQLENLNLVNNLNLHQQTVNWFPRASLLWDIGKGKNMYINYSGISISPSLEQLQPVPDLTNPYLIKVGNPDLRQQLTHNMSARYSALNSKTFQNWQISLNADYVQNQIASSSTVLAGGVQELEYVNVQGVYHTSTYITYGFPVSRQKKGNASIGLHGQYGHDISIINGLQNTSQNTGLGGDLNFNFHLQDKLFIDTRVSINQTFSKYSLEGSPENETLNENYNLNVTYRFPLDITVASYYNLQVTGSQQNLPSQAVSLWNASVFKSVFRNRFELRVSAYDILNSASSYSQTTGVNFVQTQKTNLQGRIVLCSIIYRFRKFDG